MGDLGTSLLSKNGGQSFSQSKLYDIGASCEKNKTILPSYLSAHCISGTDVVCQINTIGKIKVINALKKGISLEKNNCVESNINECVEEAIRFYSSCFGVTNIKDMNHSRYEIWKKKNYEWYMFIKQPSTFRCLIQRKYQTC